MPELNPNPPATWIPVTKALPVGRQDIAILRKGSTYPQTGWYSSVNECFRVFGHKRGLLPCVAKGRIVLDVVAWLPIPKPSAEINLARYL